MSPQRHVVRQFVDFRARQHVGIHIDVFRPSSPHRCGGLSTRGSGRNTRGSGTCWHFPLKRRAAGEELLAAIGQSYGVSAATISRLA